jgi:Helix-turn-helix domain
VSLKQTSQPVFIDAAVAVVTTKVFFNILQAARFCGTNPSWIEEMCRQGRLPFRRAGNQRIILRRDLVALIMGLPEEKGLCERPAFMKNRD